MRIGKPEFVGTKRLRVFTPNWCPGAHGVASLRPPTSRVGNARSKRGRDERSPRERRRYFARTGWCCAYAHNPAPLPFLRFVGTYFRDPAPTVLVCGVLPHRLSWKKRFGLGGEPGGWLATQVRASGARFASTGLAGVTKAPSI
jgi:hypothetical protein